MYKRVIGPYRVEEYLGRGGMAEVFRCSTTTGHVDSPVVVKRVLPELVSEPELVQMFLEEARLVRYLDHPNVVVFFDIDHDETGIPYIAMEYIHGPTLLQVVHRAAQINRRHFGCIVRIIRVIAEALEYVHTVAGPDGRGLGIVHRDVTPQNILVPSTGIPKLIDFGIAKSFLATSRTHTGILKGKVGFVAPEQINSGPVDARTDVFSLGVTLFRATTGEMPFEGRTQRERLDAVVGGRFRKPRDLIPTYPRTLEDVVVRAIQPDPNDRFLTAADFADAVGNCIGLSSLNDTQAIGYWIRELFPNEDWRVSSVDAGVSMSSGKVGYRMTNSNISSISGGTSARRAITGGEAHYIPTMMGPGLVPARYSPAQRRRKLAANVVGILLALVTLGMVVNLDAGREIVFSLLSVQTTNDEELLSYLEEIERLEGQGQLSLALEMLEQVQRIPTSNPKLVVWRSRIVASMRSPEGRKNRNLALFLDEAENLMAAERYSAALSMVSEAKQIETDDPRLTIRRNRVEEEAKKGSLLAQALLYLHSGQTDAAEEKAKKILAIDYQHQAAKLLLREISERSRVKATKSPKKKVAKTTLSVTSDPQGAVYLAGRYIGRTPIVSYSLLSGSHRVEVRSSGYRTASQDVRIGSGENKTVRIKLKRIVVDTGDKKSKKTAEVIPEVEEVEEKPKENGTLQVMSKPIGFVYINNKILGKTPILDYRLPVGTYKLEVRNSEHYPETRSFQIGTGEIKVFDIKMRPIVGTGAAANSVVSARLPLHKVDDTRPPTKELPARWRVTQRSELKRIIDLVRRDLSGQSEYSEDQLGRLFLPLEDSLAQKLQKSSDIRIFPRAMYYLALESADKYPEVDKAARFLLHRYHL